MTLVWTRQRPGIYTCGRHDLEITREACGEISGWSLFQGQRRITWQGRKVDAQAVAARWLAQRREATQR